MSKSNRDKFVPKAHWPIHNDYLIEIGRMAVLWGYLESAMEKYIAKLMGVDEFSDPRPAIVIAHMSFKQRQDALTSLCALQCEEHPHLADYRKVMDMIDKASKGRNKFVHGNLGRNPDDGKHYLFSMSARGQLKFSSEVVYVADVLEVTKKIHEALAALHNLVTDADHAPLWDRPD